MRATMSAVGGLVLAVLMSAGCQPAGGVKLSLIPTDKTLEERKVINEGLLAPKIAIVQVNGLLIDQEMNGLLTEGENPVSYVKEQLDKARNDDAVKAVILRVNSPGGTVTASEMLHEEVLRFKAKSCKPVVALLMDVAASGGYYTACASDRIVAYQSTITGSIGVIMQLFSLQGSLEALRINTYAIKSGPFKDAGSPLRDLTPEERELFQKIVEQFYGQFLAVVAKGRPNLSEDKIKTLADGRIYTAEQAKDNGLVDQIGSVYTAVDWIKQKTNNSKMSVVIYHRPQEWRPTVYAASPAGAPSAAQAGPLSIDMKSINDSLRPKFLYLWAPGM